MQPGWAAYPLYYGLNDLLAQKAAFLEEGGWSAEGERGQWPIQRAEGAARNEQATDREHATIECRGNLLSPERRFLPQKTLASLKSPPIRPAARALSRLRRGRP